VAGHGRAATGRRRRARDPAGGQGRARAAAQPGPSGAAQRRQPPRGRDARTRGRDRRLPDRADHGQLLQHLRPRSTSRTRGRCATATRSS
jgi:hypothetical protein